MKNFIFSAKKLILAALLGVVIAPTYAQEASVALPPSSEVEISIDSAPENNGDQKTFVHKHKGKLVAAVLAATAILGGVGVVFIVPKMRNWYFQKKLDEATRVVGDDIVYLKTDLFNDVKSVFNSSSDNPEPSYAYIKEYANYVFLSDVIEIGAAEIRVNKVKRITFLGELDIDAAIDSKGDMYFNNGKGWRRVMLDDEKAAA